MTPRYSKSPGEVEIARVNPQPQEEERKGAKEMLARLAPFALKVIVDIGTFLNVLVECPSGRCGLIGDVYNLLRNPKRGLLNGSRDRRLFSPLKVPAQPWPTGVCRIYVSNQDSCLYSESSAVLRYKDNLTTAPATTM
jgi:hypothetical protein